MLPEQSYVAWKVFLGLLHLFALGSTGLRLWDRFHNRKLWWDDYIAVVPMVCDVTYMVLFYLQFRRRGQLPEDPNARQIIARWAVASSFLYYTIIWASRISLSLSVTRIFAPGRVKYWLFALTTSFIAAYVVSFIFSIATCSFAAIDWRKLEVDTNMCAKGPGGLYLGGIIATTFDFLADAALVICPLVLLWKVHLPEIERRMVLAAFSASILTAFTEVVYCVFWYGGLDLGPDRRLLIAVVCHIQAAISLIVCNTLIVTMYFYRRFRTRDTHVSPAISTLSENTQSTTFSGAVDPRQRRDSRNSRPYSFPPPRDVKSGPSSGVSYDLPERFTPISDHTTSRRWQGDGESEYVDYADSEYSRHEGMDDIPSWMARGAAELSVTSTFESATKRFEAKQARKAQRRESKAGRSHSPGRHRPDEPPPS